MKNRYWIAAGVGVVGGLLAARLAVRPRDVEWEEHRGRLSHAERSRFAEVNGVRVHYQEAGEPSAPAVVLVHGFASSNWVWSEVLVPLAEEGFRVVAPDLVGFGFSGKPRDGEYTFEAQARTLTGLMDALGIGRATLVGSSYGGGVALVAALDSPERIERLVLVGAVSNDDVKRGAVARLGLVRGLGELFAPLLLDARQLRKRRKLRRLAERDGRAFDPSRVRAHQRPLKSAAAQRAVLRSLRRWDAARIEGEAQKITQPTLLVWGADDREVPLRNGERLRRLIPGARLFVFEDCAHLPQEERPREFVRLVAEFCKGVNGEW
jgi:pimeloyl-ACP methyl ester carboxylesterase